MRSDKSNGLGILVLHVITGEYWVSDKVLSVVVRY